MRGLRLTLTGAIVGTIGTGLLLFEGIRAVPLDHVLSSTSQVLMWVGLGAMSLGGLLLVVAAWSDSGATASESGEE